MRAIVPTRSLNNKALLLGLEFSDLMSIALFFVIVRFFFSSDEYIVLSIVSTGVFIFALSTTRLSFRRGIVRSFIHSLMITIKKGKR